MQVCLPTTNGVLDAFVADAITDRLVNLATGPPGVRYKESSMPFVQMENISHFLRACQLPPLSLPPHDIFQTVDLYEAKDPAQVLQCIGSFSRKAHTVQPNRFLGAIGQKRKSGLVSPQGTGNGGYGGGVNTTYGRRRGPSNASESSSTTFSSMAREKAGRISPTRTGGSDASTSASGAKSVSPNGGVSSWSKRTDEGATIPAWNIHQYGYMGGASQGNQGISFGARRQITTPGPKVPSLAEKERKRREEAAEAERLKVQAEEAEYRRRVEREAEEERDRIAEEQRWAEETRKQREREKKEAEEEKRRWDAEERKWKEEEEIRLREEQEVEAALEIERQRKRAGSDARLRGQFLSQYQAEQIQPSRTSSVENQERVAENQKVKELERQLEEAKERERQYERERQDRLRLDSNPTRQNTNEHQPKMSEPGMTPKALSVTHNKEDMRQEDERDYLRQQWSSHRNESHQIELPLESDTPPPQPPRPLPIPNSQQSYSSFQPASEEPPPNLPARPLPNPADFTPQVATPNRTERFLSTNPAPTTPRTTSHFPSELGLTTTSEVDAEDGRRKASQAKTKAGGFASKSLLEREMERERQRQQEWEESQKATKEAVARGVKDGGTGPGESWDVNQYGYTGGDNQNRGGVNFGARRQILGPRPKP